MLDQSLYYCLGDGFQFDKVILGRVRVVAVDQENLCISVDFSFFLKFCNID